MENVKIMLVDRDMIRQKLLSAYLKNRNYEVLFAKDRDEALDRLERDYADVVIFATEVSWAELTEFIQTLRGLCRKATSIITCQDRNNRLDAAGNGKDGLFDYVVKPFSVETLILKIKAMLSMQKRLNGGETN